MSIYVGQNGIAREVKDIYVGVNGVAREIYSAGPIRGKIIFDIAPCKTLKIVTFRNTDTKTNNETYQITVDNGNISYNKTSITVADYQMTPEYKNYIQTEMAMYNSNISAQNVTNTAPFSCTIRVSYTTSIVGTSHSNIANGYCDYVISFDGVNITYNRTYNPSISIGSYLGSVYDKSYTITASDTISCSFQYT